eukprot:2187257-Heterocapsa_arctica.AAC.1
MVRVIGVAFGRATASAWRHAGGSRKRPCASAWPPAGEARERVCALDGDCPVTGEMCPVSEGSN